MNVSKKISVSVRVCLWLILYAGVYCGSGILATIVAHAATITIARDLPEYASTPGEVEVSVSIQIEGQGPNGIIIKEFVPQGWQIVESNPSHTFFDPATGEISWVLFGTAAAQSATITYCLQIPVAEVKDQTVHGYLLFNDTEGNPQYVETGGDLGISTYYQDLSVTRTLPQTYDSPSWMDVILAVDVQGKKPNGLILEEVLPSGTQLVSANPASYTFNVETGVIKWVLVDQEVYSRTVSYRLLIPGGLDSTLSFTGALKYNDPMSVPVTLAAGGDSEVTYAGTAQLITGTRYLPETYFEASQVEVAVSVYIEDLPPNGLIVKEIIPEGWGVAASQPEYATFDSASGEIKWLFSGSEVVSQVISYTLEVPAGTSGTRIFTGEILYNDVTQNPQTVAIVGDCEIRVITLYSGDINDDGKLTLADAILAIKVACRMGVSSEDINVTADVNGDYRIGIAEAIYIMREMAK